MKISHGFEIGVGRGAAVRAEVGVDFGPEARHDGRVAGELVEEPGEGGGGGVAAGEQDGDELVANDLAIAREAGEGVQEGVARVRLCFLFEFFWGEAQGLLDVRVHEGVEDLEVGVEAAAGDEAVHGSAWGEISAKDRYVCGGRLGGGEEVGLPGSSDDVLHPLHFGKGLGELGLRVVEAVDARSE